MSEIEESIYTISFSREKMLRESRRKFWYRYINKFKGEMSESVPLVFGKMVHDLMESVSDKPKHLRERILNNTINKLVFDMKQSDQELYERRLQNIVPAVLTILETYEFIELEEYVKVIALEFERSSELGMRLWQMTPKEYRPPYDVGITKLGMNGYIDAYATTNGKRYILDWKTGSFSIAKFRSFQKQIQLYAHMKRLMGHRVDGGKVVWIEQGGLTKDVNTAPLTSKQIFEDTQQNFIDGVLDGTKFCYYQSDDCHAATKWYCEYSSLCGVIDKELIMLDDAFVKIALSNI